MSESYGESPNGMRDMNEQVPSMNGKNVVDDVMLLNKLHYALPSSLAASVQRANKVSYADKTIYTAGDVEILTRINASSDFQNMDNSYATADISTTAPALVNTADGDAFLTFGSGGILNYIQRVVCEARSGTQVVYEDRSFVKNNQDMYNRNSPSYILDNAIPLLALVDNSNGQPVKNSFDGSAAAPTVVSVIGTNSNIADVSLGSWVSFAGSTPFVPANRKFVIPLGLLNGFFRCSTLFAPWLASGLRIRLTIPSTALQSVQVVKALAAPTTLGQAAVTTMSTTSPGIVITINNFQIVNDCYSMAPAIYMKCMQMAASQGLDHVYESEYFGSIANTGSSVNCDINKACARALSFMLCPVPTTTPSLFFDQGQCLFANYAQYSARVGSLTFPGPTPLNLNLSLYPALNYSGYGEFYHLAQLAYKKCGDMGSNWPSDVTYRNWSQGGYGAISQSLERSNVDLAGIPVNNSRTASSLVTFKTTNACQIFYYLNYVNVLKVFLNESVLKL